MGSSIRHELKSPSVHIPVMLKEAVEALGVKKGGIYVDATFGVGGYSREILKAADCKLYVIDRDPDAIARAEKMAEEFNGRLIALQGCFGDIKELLNAAGVEKVDGIVADIGVSSIQINSPERGFSFQSDGPLDMRMSKSGQSAADVVNSMAEEELANIIFKYGEERASRKIAKKIVEEREIAPIETTLQLTKIVHMILPQYPRLKTNTATKTFQALRIYVNNELGELEKLLTSSEALLNPEGRLVIVSFHSLEDGRVKEFFKERSGMQSNSSRHMPELPSSEEPSFKVEKRSGLKASPEEVALNPRSRSAHLRYGIRTSAPAWKSGGFNA